MVLQAPSAALPPVRPKLEWFLYSGRDISDPLNSTYLLALKMTFATKQWGWYWVLTREQFAAAEVLWPLLKGKPRLMRGKKQTISLPR